MTLADDVLPLIRGRSGFLDYYASNAQGAKMHEGIDILEAAIPQADPKEAHTVTHKALTSAIKVIARADDSSGIIGDACGRLLTLHPRTAAAAHVPPAKLVDWMMKFQFDGDVDFFTLDPVAYAPALGDLGMRRYREALAEKRKSVEAKGDDDHARGSFELRWNDRRLAVHDRDIEAIIRTHARDQGRRIAAWYVDTSEALEEIGEIELAIEWARDATTIGPAHQSIAAGDRWCRLLAEHHPDQVLAAREFVFGRWPDASTAAHLYKAAGNAWPAMRDSVMSTLEPTPWHAVGFALHTLKDPAYAWELAHRLDLEGDSQWSELAKAYAKVDPMAVLPVHLRLVEGLLVEAGAQNYRQAARRLATMKKLAAGTDRADWVDGLIADLREKHRRRPRLQQEFDRAGL